MSIAQVADRLQGGFSGVIHPAEPLSRHTTFRIGGPAALFVEADTVSDLKLVLAACSDAGVPHALLGKGSNVLVSDRGYDGVVIVLGRDFKHHTVDGARIKTGAGVILAHVVRDAYSLGLAGLEFAVGIPGTVGGAVAMNAGSREAWIGTAVESVTVYDPRQGLVGLRHSDIRWGYRSTSIPGEGIVVECVLRLEMGDKDRIRRTMDSNLRTRKASQPLSLPSAGSVFRNPDGESAGRLIEDCGLKGIRVGGAQISETHANFIVNLGGASASDVASLIEAALTAVKDKHGIELKPEIKFLGSFDPA